jgi:hypothetical protein
MHDPVSPSPTLEPHDDLPNRLDALGRSLASREPSRPSDDLLRAVRARRNRPIALRIGLLAAALIALACGLIYFTSHSAPTATPAPIVTNDHKTTPPTPPVTAKHQSPTLATLRKLNPDPASDSLILPTITTTSSPTSPARPGDAHDPSALARIAGTAR